MAEEIDLPKPLDLGSGQGHTGGHIRLRSTHTPKNEIRKTFCGRTDGRIHPTSLSLLGHRLALT